MPQAVAAHHTWLAQLLEMWVVVARLGDSRTAAARQQYGRLLHASLRDPSLLTSHPAAVGARFRLLTLGLVYAQSAVKTAATAAGNQPASRTLLIDQILRAVSEFQCLLTVDMACNAQQHVEYLYMHHRKHAFTVTDVAQHSEHDWGCKP